MLSWRAWRRRALWTAAGIVIFIGIPIGVHFLRQAIGRIPRAPAAPADGVDSPATTPASSPSPADNLRLRLAREMGPPHTDEPRPVEMLLDEDGDYQRRRLPELQNELDLIEERVAHMPSSNPLRTLYAGELDALRKEREALEALTDYEDARTRERRREEYLDARVEVERSRRRRLASMQSADTRRPAVKGRETSLQGLRLLQAWDRDFARRMQPVADGQLAFYGAALSKSHLPAENRQAYDELIRALRREKSVLAGLTAYRDLAARSRLQADYQWGRIDVLSALRSACELERAAMSADAPLYWPLDTLIAATADEETWLWRATEPSTTEQALAQVDDYRPLLRATAQAVAEVARPQGAGRLQRSANQLAQWLMRSPRASR